MLRLVKRAGGGLIDGYLAVVFKAVVENILNEAAGRKVVPIYLGVVSPLQG